jgi:hypothetical protein
MSTQFVVFFSRLLAHACTYTVWGIVLKGTGNGCKNRRTHISYWRTLMYQRIYRKEFQFMNVKSEEPLKNLKTSGPLPRHLFRSRSSTFCQTF